MKYNTYIFDLDGTILDTLLDLANAVNFAMRAKGFPERTTDEVRNFIGNGIKVLIKRAVPENTSEDDYAETLEIFTKYYLDLVLFFVSQLINETEYISLELWFYSMTFK